MSITKKNIANRTIKIGFAIWLMLSCACAFSMICANSTSNVNYSGQVIKDDVLTFPFIMAFRDEHFSDYHIYQSTNYAEFSNKIADLSNGTCSAILGLFSSKDCLIAGPILAKNKTIGISSSCVNNNITKFFPYIYTASPTQQSFSKSMADWLSKRKNVGTIYAFYQPASIFSSTAYEAFKKYHKGPIVGIPTNSNGQFNLNSIQQRDMNKPATMIFFTYTMPSAQSLIELDSNKLINHHTIIIGDTSWIFELSAIRPIKSILEKSNGTFTQTIIDRKAVSSSAFYAKFKKRLHHPPDAIEVISYDIARFSTECYKKTITNGKFNNKDFLSCLRTTHYQGIAGPITFSADSPFSTRKIYFINLLDWL